ncbi:sulfotransferase domain-containing protein, partial [Candidatus Micrarchaeota archaeon]|nr:sulfotransferase domain-containing protein [Candidatus Micrarchaeota archaeon]
METGFFQLIKIYSSNLKNTLTAIRFLFRLFTSPIRTLPDFIIAGFPKCGTTSLYEYLIQHPSIFPAFSKETYFFHRHYSKGLLWYRAYFPTVLSKFVQRLRKRKFVTGEATPSYAADPSLHKKIYDMNPKIKLILLLRNPTDKAFSNFNHLVRKGMADDIADAIKADLGTKENIRKPSFRNLVSGGIYLNYLKELYKVFPKEQVLILKSEDLFSNPKVAVNKCFRFLGLE